MLRSEKWRNRTSCFYTWICPDSTSRSSSLNRSVPCEPAFSVSDTHSNYALFLQEATLPLPPRPIPNPTLATAAPSPLPPNFLSSDPHLWRIYDPESIRIMADVNGEGNPVEAKYRRLARSHRTGRGDRELKPGPDMRDLLNVSANAFRYEFVGT